MNTYRGWVLLETMPDGWRFDGAGSPLHGYSFVTNGKSVVNGQQRALLRVMNPQRQLLLESPRQEVGKVLPLKPEKHQDASYAKTVNELAREKFKLRILADILVDLTICEIEGWSKLEYISELKSLIDGIGSQELPAAHRQGWG